MVPKRDDPVGPETDPPRNRTCLACHPEVARRKLKELSSPPREAKLAQSTEAVINDDAVDLPTTRRTTQQNVGLTMSCSTTSDIFHEAASSKRSEKQYELLL